MTQNQYLLSLHSIRLTKSSHPTLARSTRPFSLLDQVNSIVSDGIDYLVLDISAGPLKQEMRLVTSLLGNKHPAPEQILGNNLGTGLS